MSSDTEDDKKETIKVVGNSIYFYTDVTPETVQSLVVQFRRAEVDTRTQLLKAGLMDTKPTIHVHICSNGGDLHSGLAAMDTLADSESNVVTYAEGLCASAAALMFLGGHKRVVRKSAYVLIHQLSADTWGTLQEIVAEVKNLKKIQTQIENLLLEKTRLPTKILKRLMSADIVLDHAQCLKYGLVL
jgi:ATP-dependent protease ClpP protease subunit